MKRTIRMAAVWLAVMMLAAGCGREPAALYSNIDADKSKATTEGNTESTEPEEIETEDEAATTVTLYVYDQLAGVTHNVADNWLNTVLEDELGVNIIVYSEANSLGLSKDDADIFIYGAYELLDDSISCGGILELDEELLAKYGDSFLTSEELQARLETAKTLYDGHLYWIPTHMSAEAGDQDSTYGACYNWALRYDLYEQSNATEVKTLEDYVEVLAAMKELSDEDGYGVSLYNNSSDVLPSNMAAIVSAYYGLYSSSYAFIDEAGNVSYCLDEEGAYVEVLHFLNSLYRAGLLDPDSKDADYSAWLEKIADGENLMMLIGTSQAALAFENDERLSHNEIFLPVIANEAVTLQYKLPEKNSCYAIASDSEYPELAMQLINWLASPEGMLTVTYGPEGVCWTKDEDGNTALTEFGLACQEDHQVLMTGAYGQTFGDGKMLTVVPLSVSSTNHSSGAGENYDYTTWSSMQGEASCEALADWREATGEVSVWDYTTKAVNSILVTEEMLAKAQAEQEKLAQNPNAEDLKTLLREGSWNAVFAQSEEEFEQVLADLRTDALSLGYDDIP